MKTPLLLVLLTFLVHIELIAQKSKIIGALDDAKDHFEEALELFEDAEKVVEVFVEELNEVEDIGDRQRKIENILDDIESAIKDINQNLDEAEDEASDIECSGVEDYIRNIKSDLWRAKRKFKSASRPMSDLFFGQKDDEEILEILEDVSGDLKKAYRSVDDAKDNLDRAISEVDDCED